MKQRYRFLTLVLQVGLGFKYLYENDEVIPPTIKVPNFADS